MAEVAVREEDILCPSAQPTMEDSVIFGVVGGTVDEPRVGYLERTLPLTEEVTSLTSPVKPTEVFRLAARCAGAACQHYEGGCCSLARRLVAFVPPVVNTAPPCAIRAE